MIIDNNIDIPSPAEIQQLAQAVENIEQPSFAARIAQMAGQPVNSIIKLLPRFANDRLRDIVKVAILGCLKTAIRSLQKGPSGPATIWAPKALTGLAGGVGGFFGMVALPIELPITTTIMLRSIADIARSEGEDITQVETWLACLEVFALGVREDDPRVNIDYYAVRTVLTSLTRETATYLMERGVVEASAPVMTRLLAEIVSRFGLVVSERVAAGAVPLIGAFGGASVNVIFMEHFQRIAQGHFTIRRLERKYGAESVEKLYHEMAAQLKQRRR